MRASLAPLVIACCLGFVATASAADEKNPDVQACAGKKAGDACQRTVVTKPADGPAETKKLPGACAQDECCELDYSKGSPPETVCGPCLACKEGPGTPPANAEGGAAAGSGADGSAPDPAAGPSAPGDSPPAADPGKRGCSVVGTPERGAGLFALAVLAFVSRRRR